MSTRWTAGPPLVGRESTQARRRSPRIAAMFLICALAVVAVSALAASSVAKVDTAQQPGTPGTMGSTPGPPYFVVGYVYDSGGAPVVGASINVTDLATGESNWTEVTDSSGFYTVDIANGLPNGYTPGDLINVTATNGVDVGWNESVSDDTAFLWMDVTLTGAIPEFPMVALPVIGIAAMVIIVSTRRRKSS